MGSGRRSESANRDSGSARVKRLFLAALLVLGTTAHATGVDVAWRLYLDCMQTSFDNTRFEKPVTSAEIDKVLTDANRQCLRWTIIWYEPITGDDPRTWSKGQMDQFEARRSSLIKNTRSDLRKILGVR